MRLTGVEDRGEGVKVVPRSIPMIVRGERSWRSVGHAREKADGEGRHARFQEEKRETCGWRRAAAAGRARRVPRAMRRRAARAHGLALE